MKTYTDRNPSANRGLCDVCRRQVGVGDLHQQEPDPSEVGIFLKLICTRCRDTQPHHHHNPPPRRPSRGRA